MTARPLVLGHDPASCTGLAIWGRDGIQWSIQDDEHRAIIRAIVYLRERKAAGEELVKVVQESQFVGPNPASGLHVARSAGKMEGALLVAGYPTTRQGFLVHKASSSWRSALGINKKGTDKKEAALAFAAPHVGHRLPDDEHNRAEAICLAAVGWEEYVRNNVVRPWVAADARRE